MLFLPMLDAAAEYNALSIDWQKKYLSSNIAEKEELADLRDWFVGALRDISEKYRADRIIILEEHQAEMIDADLDWFPGHIGMTIS